MGENIRKIIHFVTSDIWRISEDEVGARRLHLYNVIRVMYKTLQEFINGRVVDRASALTYKTLLAAVPILAILFAIARGFGFDNIMDEIIYNTLQGHTEAADAIFELVNKTLMHAKSSVIVGVGIVMLLWTILSLITNIEYTFNHIWQVKKQRTLYRKITDYFSLLFLIPIFIVLSSGVSIFMTTMLKDVQNYALLGPMLRFLIRLSPFILTSTMFTVLYIFMPNTKVKLGCAIFPGILAGTSFQFFQYLYINSQLWVSKYNAIYGSFAAIPLFLLWTQMSWIICLYGAELCYVTQNLKNYKFAYETDNISRRYHDFLCTVILSLICKRFAVDEQPYTVSDLSELKKIPIRLTTNIIYELQTLGLIRETPSQEDEKVAAYLPACDINRITVADLANRLDESGTESFKIDKKNLSLTWDKLEEARNKYYQETGKILLKDL